MKNDFYSKINKILFIFCCTISFMNLLFGLSFQFGVNLMSSFITHNLQLLMPFFVAGGLISFFVGLINLFYFLLKKRNDKIQRKYKFFIVLEISYILVWIFLFVSIFPKFYLDL